jgi:hypothetical protein
MIEVTGIFRTNEMHLKLKDIRRRERPGMRKHQRRLSNDWNP